MIITSHPTEHVTGIAGGTGKALMCDWIPDNALPPNVKMISTVTLEPGSSVGHHQHTGECEIYQILSGRGMYNDNGTMTEVKEGDVTVCYSGEVHGLENNADQPLVFNAVIIKG